MIMSVGHHGCVPRRWQGEMSGDERPTHWLYSPIDQPLAPLEQGRYLSKVPSDEQRSGFSGAWVAGAGDARRVLLHLMGSFDGNRRRLATTDAEGGNTTFGALLGKRMQKRDDYSCSRGPDRVPKRTSATVHVELIRGDTKVALCSHGNGGESLIDLEQIDIADGPTRLVQELADSGDRRGREPGGILAMSGMGPQYRQHW